MAGLMNGKPYTLADVDRATGCTRVHRAVAWAREIRALRDMAGKTADDVARTAWEMAACRYADACAVLERDFPRTKAQLIDWT